MTLNYACFWTLLLLAALGPTGEATLYLDDHCGETVTSHGDRLYSQSSINYDNNMDCRMTIQAPYDYQRVTLDFVWVDLHRHDCDDHINVYDTDGKVLEICGNWEPRDLYSKGNSIDVELVTDNSGVDRGFNLVFTAFHNDLPCNDTFQFRCYSNDRCIDNSLVCDDKNNCNNASDEDNCSGTRVWLIIIVSLTLITIVAALIYAVYYSCTQNKKEQVTANDQESPVTVVTGEDHYSVPYAGQQDFAMTTYPPAQSDYSVPYAGQQDSAMTTYPPEPPPYSAK